VEELLQKHRTFTLSLLVGGFVFLVALLLRGCAVYDLDLPRTHADVERRARELTADPVPDDAYLARLDQIVADADARVADLAGRVGRTGKGDALWEECVGDVLRGIGKDSPEERKRFLDLARRLPSAAFSQLHGDVRAVLLARASDASVEIVKDDLGFDRVTDAEFTKNLAALAAVVRVVDRAIREGVARVENVVVGQGMERKGGAEGDPFLRSQDVAFDLRGEPAALAAVVRSLNERDREGTGRRLVLDSVSALGRALSIKSSDPGRTEFRVRVLLVNLDAREEERP